MTKGKPRPVGHQHLELEHLHLDERVQQRVSLCEERLEHYTELYREGTELPPIVAYEDHEGVVWLADGFHRVAAAQRAGLTQIRVDLRRGTRRDALKYSLGANEEHGLPRSREDKRKAVTTALADAEWGQLSDRELARLCRVSHTFVANIRRELASPPEVSAAGNVATPPNPTNSTRAFLAEPLDGTFDAQADMSALLALVRTFEPDIRGTQKYGLNGVRVQLAKRIGYGHVRELPVERWRAMVASGEQAGLWRLLQHHLELTQPPDGSGRVVVVDVDDPAVQGHMAALEGEEDEDQEEEDEEDTDTNDTHAPAAESEIGREARADALELVSALEAIEAQRAVPRGAAIPLQEAREGLNYVLGVTVSDAWWVRVVAAAVERGLLREDGDALRLQPRTAAKPSKPPVPAMPSALDRSLVDLRCCDVTELLEQLEDNTAALVVADPPWLYRQSIGNTPAAAVYSCLPTDVISRHISAAYRIADRLALWCTCPLLGEWMGLEHAWGQPVSSGAWVRSGEGDTGHYGQGWHWAGSAELVLLYAKKAAHCDRTVATRNGWVAPPSEHSRKPVGWQTQWVRRWVPEGGLVLDLYAGLGSVAEAVLLAGGGRRYIGAEIDPSRHAQALANIEALCSRGTP